MSGTTIPLASVRRCVDHANPGAVFSKAAYEGLLICCEEFITMVTSEASNTRPNTLKIDHLQLALKGLDFEALCSHLPEQEQDGESCFYQSNESESDAEASTGVSSSNKKKKKTAQQIVSVTQC
uniref:Transcription factor CBF/NF-Y/archaeal histone domain-containing protein n=1 Tax=Heterosigma akashiwo TaxID=2829 RepID=A0A7S4D8B0_HETAK|mmetsp:Transcript_42617/g.74061  ORF Transcript_42617/g.74061 Transcript_42617/m.74061 type:complete len:124 (-) Transcript_42617:433-804(-)